MRDGAEIGLDTQLTTGERIAQHPTVVGAVAPAIAERTAPTSWSATQRLLFFAHVGVVDCGNYFFVLAGLSPMECGSALSAIAS